MIDNFVNAVLDVASQVNSYELGASGENGKCDCIGLVIGALRKIGFKWIGTHGTNYTVRNALNSLSDINGVNSLSVGELVFKRRNKGDKGYSLPSRYANDKDQTDYYHVGVVISVSPLKIIHCTGVVGAIATDTKLGKWSVHGQLAVLNALADKNENEGDKVLKVKVSGGNLEKPIHFRASTSTSSKLIGEIPQGTVVDYLSDSGDWSKIIYNGLTGYVLSKFVTKEIVQPDEYTMPAWLREKLVQADLQEQALRATMDEIFERIGRG